jgi:hypothetical protein
LLTEYTSINIPGVSASVVIMHRMSFPCLCLCFCLLPVGVRAESLGPVALRGKESGLELFALTRE